MDDFCHSYCPWHRPHVGLTASEWSLKMSLFQKSDELWIRCMEEQHMQYAMFHAIPTSTNTKNNFNGSWELANFAHLFPKARAGQKRGKKHYKKESIFQLELCFSWTSVKCTLSSVCSLSKNCNKSMKIGNYIQNCSQHSWLIDWSGTFQ